MLVVTFVVMAVLQRLARGGPLERARRSRSDS